MKGLNSCTFIGNLGGDPEVRYTASGKAVANVSLAVNEKWTSQGEKQESTTWIRLTMWDKLAEIAGQYLSKGAPVYVQGALKIADYEDKDGVKRLSVTLTVSNLIMLGGSGGESGDPPSRTERGAPQGGQRQPAYAGGGGSGHAEHGEDDMDLPF